MYLYLCQGYFQAFCSQFNRFLSDKVHLAFSLAFTLTTDQGTMSEGELVPDDAWYHTITQDEDDEVSITTCLPFNKSTAPGIYFELGMNLVYKYGQGGNEAVVYEGSSADGLVQMIRNKDGSKIMVHDGNLSLLYQPDLSNIPSVPLNYRNEVEKGLSYDESQSLAQPISLSPIQQELTSWHRRLYCLPFNKIFLLANDRRLSKKLLE